jgi:transcriptional regulator with XRE-family HTH domain
MADKHRLGLLILEAARRKAQRDKIKHYSLHNLADAAGTVQPYLTRITHGKSMPSRNMLIKICKALGCSPQEAQEIMHAAGYHLSPDELDEEESAA